jgi:hypothetical protein
MSEAQILAMSDRFRYAFSEQKNQQSSRLWHFGQRL